MPSETTSTVRPDEYASWDAVAQVENDRFCHKCGYNLRTNPVRRHPETELLVARCPECATFTPVSEPGGALRPWIGRLVSILVFAWMGALLAMTVAFIAGSVGNHLLTLEARTSYTRIAVPPPQKTAAPATGGPIQVMPLANGGTVTIPANPGFRFQRQIDATSREYWIVKFVMLGLAMLMVLVVATIIMAVMPHWPRLVYLLVFALVPIVPAVIAFLIWRDDQPDFADWGAVQIAHTWLAQVTAAVLAALLGRAPLRLLARVLLPSRLRAPLAYLWLVDGRTPPVAAEAPRPAEPA